MNKAKFRLEIGIRVPVALWRSEPRSGRELNQAQPYPKARRKPEESQNERSIW